MLSFDQFRHAIEGEIMARETADPQTPDDILAASTLRALLPTLPPRLANCEMCDVWDAYDGQ